MSAPHALPQVRHWKTDIWLEKYNNIRNLIYFHTSSQKSENLHFDRILLSKAYKDLDEKVLKSFMTLNNDAKIEEKLSLSSINDMRDLVNFYPTTQKSENFTSMDYKP